MKILFFIGTLRSGGKERRLIELLSHLKQNTDYEMLVVLRQNHIDYPAFERLDIPYKMLTENYKKKDIRLPFRFLKICSEYRPDIIHTWGSMPAFVSIIATILLRIPHINSQITDAPPTIKSLNISNFINKINFRFSDIILSNSMSGLNSYKPPKFKSRVIYNGVNLMRFKNLPDQEEIRKKHNISTPFGVIMVGSFSNNKDFDLFVNIANTITVKRKDISFICVGDGTHLKRIKEKAKENQNIIFTGRIIDVEALVNACDIGVLFSPNGEGLSNAIIEYMALGKPVIANDSGGTNEIVKHGINGFLVTDIQPGEIAELVELLINNTEKRNAMGTAGRQFVEERLTVDRMGKEFINLYHDILTWTKQNQRRIKNVNKSVNLA